ncbi:MAG TPA: APC family permease [Pseudonocardiaceae bacterium]|nr:APC family permease [Pseudonocardiaceae bacterium]
MATPVENSSEPPPTQLAGGSIGLPQVLFQSAANMSPAGAVAFSLLIGYAYAGSAMPLSVLLVVVAIALISVCIGQLAKAMPAAGGFYTYASTALGPAAGFLIGWGYLLVEAFVAPIAAMFIGSTTQEVFANSLHLDAPWWIWALLTLLVINLLNYRGVRLATGVGLVLGVLELLVIAALAIWMIVKAGGANTWQVFNPTHALSGTWSGVFKGMVFGILAVQGFEAAAPLGEEARNPRRTVPRAVIGASLLVGGVMLLCTYGTVMGWGAGRIAGYANDPDPWNTLARHFWGAGWVLIFLAIVNSLFAAGNAGMAASSRMLFSMGRNNIVPTVFARSHPRHRTPYVAILTQTAVGAALALALGVGFGVVNGFSVMAIALTVIVILVYIAICVSVPVYYLRQRRAEFRILPHLVCPVLGVAAMIGPLYFQFAPLPSYPSRWGLWLALLWTAAGIAIVVWASRKRPDVLRAALRIFGGDSARSPEPSVVG